MRRVCASYYLKQINLKLIKVFKLSIKKFVIVIINKKFAKYYIICSICLTLLNFFLIVIKKM